MGRAPGEPASDPRGALSDMPTVVGWAGRMARDVSWYVTSLMGDRAYATYAAHHRAVHGDDPPMTERQFWAERYREQDSNPGSRCC